MSIAVSSAVWKHGPIERNQRFVLLAIADNANDDGYAFPLIEKIAAKCVMSKRNVLRLIKILSDDGWVSVSTSPKNYKANAYQIDLSKVSGDKLSGDKSSMSQVTNSTVSGDKPGIPILSNVNNGHRTVVTRVFEYYCKEVGKNPNLYTLTDARMQKGLLRLNDCLKKTKGNREDAHAMMNLCVDALAASEWHMGKNDQKRPFNDWTDHLFKSTDKLEKWLEEADRG